jgi:hypothetical protein
MPKYRFIVQSPSGKARRGTISEKDEHSAQVALETAGFKVVSLTEKTDLVVHTPSGAAAASGRPSSKPERAALIEFEDSPGEKVKMFLNTFVLRREVVIVLMLMGLAWIVYAWATQPEKKPPPELEYQGLNITVTFDTSDYPDADRALVRIPEIPFTHTEDFQSDESPRKVNISIEVAKEPQTVEVTLIEGTSTPIASGRATLDAGTEKGAYSAEVLDFEPIKKEGI